jgi:hypothetical protein
MHGRILNHIVRRNSNSSGDLHEDPQIKVGEWLGLPQRKVFRIIASVTKSLKEKLSQLR